MLNDKHSMESAKLSNIEDILNNIGFLGEKKEKEDDDKDEKAGEDQEHKYTKKSGKKSKDYDGDGDVEDETDEYAGVKDKAIKKAMKKESIEIDSILDELTSEDIIFLTDELIEEVVEEFFNEMIEEGFDAECIETLIVESIDQELTVLSEAKVTMGHDTEDSSPKEDKLAKVKSAVKKVASGAKKVATKVAGAAGEIAGAAKAGYQKTAGSSSGGTATSSTSADGSQKPSFLSRAASALKRGLKKVVGKTARVASKVGNKVATRLGEAIDPKGAARMDAAKDKKKIDVFAYDKKVAAMKAAKSAEMKKEELMSDELEGTTYEVVMEDGETILIEKEKGLDGKACWKGYKLSGTKQKGGRTVDNCVKSGYEMDGEEMIYEDDQFLQDVEVLADWLHEEGIIENEDQFFELMEDLTEEEIDELYDVVFEATAMAKRGHDETKLRKRAGGGEAADRATALEKKPTYGDANKAKQRSEYARKQRGDFRNTASSSPGLHGYGHKSDDPKVKAKQAARGAQRGALTPKERKDLNMGYEMIGNSLEEGGLEVQNIQEISADLALRASKQADIKRGKLAHTGDKEGAVKKMNQASRLYKKSAEKRKMEGVEMIGDSLEEGGLEVRNYSWREVLESQEARNNPEKYEREQSKKSAPVRGEKTPMPPRGDKRREDFEKWYAKNVR